MAAGALALGRLPRARPEPRVGLNTPKPEVSGLAAGEFAGAGKSVEAGAASPDLTGSDMFVLV